MALYTYKKDDTPKYNYTENVIIDGSVISSKKKFKLSDIPAGIYKELKSLTRASKLANLLIPGLFILLGVFFIYKEFLPDIQSMIQKSSGYLTQGNVSPVADQYIDLSKYISRPIDFPQLTYKAMQENILQDDKKSLEYQGTFYLSIPSLGMDKIPVQANVDSTVEDSYMDILNSKLAHFKNTSLPISDVKNNMLIYGHSASPNYGPNANDPMVAFSFLPNIQVGADIYIEIEEQTYHYKMYKSRIADPTDTSVISGTKGKATLTLVTCFPLGSNESRFVAIARPVDN